MRVVDWQKTQRELECVQTGKERETGSEEAIDEAQMSIDGSAGVETYVTHVADGIG